MKKFRILAFFVILTLIIVPFTSSALPQLHVYTALGDSIAYGTGGSDGYFNDNYGYVDMLIERNFLIGLNFDLSDNGYTSAGLLAALTDTSHPAYTDTRNAVGYADDITISIGGNDLLQIFIPLYEADPDFLSHLTFRQRLVITTQLMTNTRNFGPNWKNIISNIRLLNTDANIYVNTLYNPFSTSDPLFYFADPFIQSINRAIKTNASTYNYEVADVYTAFKGVDNMVYDIDGAVPLHPTNEGYEVIYDLHNALIS